MEVPECPVCLEAYDGNALTPRVLACGHSVCETCLAQLPEKHPHTIRCPACTQLVKIPYPQGPSGLPKNIDLLRFSPSDKISNRNNQKSDEKPSKLHQFLPQFWSDEFYMTWKGWILPYDAISIDLGAQEEDGGGICCLLSGFYVKEDKKVSLFHVTSSSLAVNYNDRVFNYSYTSQVIKFLCGMRMEERDELSLILRVCSKQNRVCKVFGLWYNSNNKSVYLVCEKYNSGSVLKKLGASENEIIGQVKDVFDTENGVSTLAMIGMEITEAIINLHSEGVVIGCLGFSCLRLDEFGHVYINMNEILLTGKKVNALVSQAIHGEKEFNNEKLRLIYDKLLKIDAFVSPELFLESIRNEGIVCGNSFEHTLNYSSDVWSLAFMFIRLLIGEKFTEDIFDCVHNLPPTNGEEQGLHNLQLGNDWDEKIRSLLEAKLEDKYRSLSKILCECLNINPVSRPLVTDIWKCFNNLIFRHFDSSVNKNRIENKGYCLASGNLCKYSKENSKGLEGEIVDETEAVPDQNGLVSADKDIVEGVSGGNFKFESLQGHLDCITGLAVGGGFLFSSSFDKTVTVWSLKDFTRVHSFVGHEHRVMAVAYVDGEKPSCVSGDSGGGIFIWNVSNNIPFEENLLTKWYEEKDWRYSGIHALTVSADRYLYTGSGDKLIKAWSLKDYTLECTMSGHKSVVSALAICNGTIYSGSWDGTIRLWSLSDHSPLSVLEEDTPGNVSSILSLSVNYNMLVAAHDNGCIKIWRDDVFRRSLKAHDGAIFTVCMDGNRLFSGGWDMTLIVQELSGDEFHLEVVPIGSISCETVIPALLYWQGKFIVGCADKSIKVYYCGR